METNRIYQLLEEVTDIINDYRINISDIVKKEAIGFNIFNEFFRLGENKLSEIIAFFLDPKESHGQGNIFLDSFLSIIGHKMNGLDKDDLLCKVVYVKTERQIDNNRRIDIYIEFGDKEFVIAIENKIGAKDQDTQLADYYEYINKAKKGNVLIYLTPFGKRASEKSLNNGNEVKLGDDHYIRLDYSELFIELISNWKDIAEPIKVKLFLNDLGIYLNELINNKSIMSTLSSRIANELVKNNDNTLEAAFEVSLAISEVKNKLFEELKSILIKYKFSIDSSFGQPNSEATLELYHGSIIAITFLDYQDYFILGLSNGKSNKVYSQNIILALENLKIGKNEEWSVWDWNTRADSYSRWNVVEPWLKIKNGEFESFINKVVTAVEQVPND